MHDLNNVLHMIGTGVYHASTQIGDQEQPQKEHTGLTLQHHPNPFKSLCCFDSSFAPPITAPPKGVSARSGPMAIARRQSAGEKANPACPVLMKDDPGLAVH